MEDTRIRVENINAGKGFKIKWTDFKKAHHTCDLEGKNSNSCKQMLKDLGIDLYE